MADPHLDGFEQPSAGSASADPAARGVKGAEAERAHGCARLLQLPAVASGGILPEGEFEHLVRAQRDLSSIKTLIDTQQLVCSVHATAHRCATD